MALPPLSLSLQFGKFPQVTAHRAALPRHHAIRTAGPTQPFGNFAQQRVANGMAVLVVGCALGRVRQHLVGFLALLELVLSVFAGVVLVAVGVVLHR